ncbi:hypothetical protein COU59_01450 [Candidatus Pacearchaeota archaeon CG10_big_fil_rev_8_21_14_0_10_34_12]|nr:MAG: hypothetical protein COU59_01450 [Candidatus Pacearchaeota archaeon CG10_big_fil_rev_8_21_14_0_10_34_12]
MKAKENKSLFLRQFGDTPQLRVMDFFIENSIFDFPLTEIAREGNVSYNSLKSFIDDFLKMGFVVKTRKVGKSDYYRINKENPFVTNLIRLDFALSKNYALNFGNKSLIPA